MSSQVVPHGSLLIIEDELGPAESLRMIFKSICDVIIVRDLPSALAVMRTRRVDVITLDLQLGSSLGGEGVRDLCQTDSTIEILAITGLPPSASLVREVKALGAHYIAKPFKVEQVRNIVLDAVARRAKQAHPASERNGADTWIDQLRVPVRAIIAGIDSLHGQDAFAKSPQLEILASLRAHAQALRALLGDRNANIAIDQTTFRRASGFTGSPARGPLR